MKEGAFGASIMRPEEHKQLDQSKHEMKEGLPIISSEEYERLYNMDIRAMGEQGAATFNFQGFMREAREGHKHGVFYRDVITTNGLLKEEGHEGVHVGTDGVIDFSADTNYEMKSPKDVGEYDLYITIPGELQKKAGVFCSGDSCYAVEGAGSDPIYTSQDIKAAQEEKGYIVRRYTFDPKEDPRAREKAQLMHQAVVRHIETGQPLWKLGGIIDELENRLQGIAPEEVENVQRSLEKPSPKKLGA